MLIGPHGAGEEGVHHISATVSIGRRAIAITVLAMVLCFVNYLDRVVISFAIEPIKQEFGLTNTSFGLAISLFAFGALAVNGLSGLLLDRFGVRLIWTIGLVLWSLAMLGLGLTAAWVFFLAMRFVLGFGEGVNFPAMNRSVADWLPGRLAGRAVGFMLLGVPAALLLGGPVLATLIEHIDWRNAFIVLAIVSGLIGVALPLIYRRPPKRKTESRHVHWWELLRNPTLLATSWSFFSFGYVLWFGITWIPGYFEQTWHMDLTKIGWFSTLPWGLACLLIPLVAWYSDTRMTRTGRIRSARVHPIWIFQLLGALCFVPLIFTHSQTVAIAMLSLGIGFSMAANAPYYSICTDLFHRNAAAATGIMVTFFSISGLVTPVLTGWLTDAFGGFDAAFIALAVFVTSGSLGMLCFAHPDRGTT
ncbi:MAG: MFS transporter [Phycisphaerales bacterium]|nr:MFS transporter [Phycisphaerales bacterium]MDP6986468.1 MFS transporter [Phycisphaerales bacterium]